MSLKTDISASGLFRCPVVTVMLLGTVLLSYPAYAGRGGGGNKVTVVGGGFRLGTSTDKYKFGDINGRMRRIEEDIEDVEKKLRNADPGSKRRLNLQQEREKLGLEMIHVAQRYFFDYGIARNDGRTRKLNLLLQNESKILQDTLKQIPEFPFADRLTEISQVMLDIRSGKERFNGKVPRNNKGLLNEIQEVQEKLLKEFHKEQRKNRPRGGKKK